MKQVSQRDWNRFRRKMTALSEAASKEMGAWIYAKGGYAMVEFDEAIAYAYALVTKYGEASASLAALMYDAVAELSNAAVPVAEVAPTATYGEVSKSIYGASTFSQNEEYISGVVGRLVKQAGADTTLQNAKRDGAQFAWIGSGDSCTFCELLSANGWQYASKETLKGNHAEHIHSNCDCQFMIRFDNNMTVAGYKPNRDLYYDTEGTTMEEKANTLRRERYDREKDRINEQKRIAYAKRMGNDEEI